MNRFALFFFFFLTLSQYTAGQTPLDWSDLEGGISWQKTSLSNATYPGFIEADFSDRLTHLEGKQVSLVGFLLVLDGSQPIYMLSKNPMASCFFCGNGGPESISEVEFAQGTNFVMDDLVTVTGILRLNRNDPTRSYYRLEKADAFGL